MYKIFDIFQIEAKKYHGFAFCCSEMMVLFKRHDATSITPPLSEAGGYVVVIVVGLVFAFGMRQNIEFEMEELLTLTSNGLRNTSIEENSWRGQLKDRDVRSSNSEVGFMLMPHRFMTANRSVRTGLTASAVISVGHSCSLKSVLT